MNTMKIIGKENVNFAFDASNRPAAEVEPGASVIYQCQDCYAGQLDCDGKEFTLIDMKKSNPITGPVAVCGAEPGDVLEVEIIKIEIADSGAMCVREGSGIYDVTGANCRRFPVKDGEICFDKGIRIPIRPMIGVIGTCPAGEVIPTRYPGEHGGNMDIREIGEGCKVYLPVSVPGAMLSMGDLHAVQGDGESAICGMEISGNVTVKVRLLKAPQEIPTPFLETETAYYTTAAHESLDVCSVEAARKMHGWLMKKYDLSDAQAAMLLSLQGNLRISQVVNPKKGCIMEFPKRILEGQSSI